jgi:hypothetical protein
MKMRTFSRGSTNKLWLEEYRNPLIVDIPIPAVHSLHEISQALQLSLVDGQDEKCDVFSSFSAPY